MPRLRKAKPRATARREALAEAGFDHRPERGGGRAPRFGKPDILLRENVDTAILDLLPRVARTISAEREAERMAWFGTGKKLPALPVAALNAAARLSSGGP